jgi:hypothetical protein
MSTKSDTVNKEEVSITNISLEKNWHNWNLPLVPQNKILRKQYFQIFHFFQIIQ